MNNNWKGIAISGMWIAFAIDAWACALYELVTRDVNNWTNTPVFWVIVVLTVIIIYHKDTDHKHKI